MLPRALCSLLWLAPALAFLGSKAPHTHAVSGLRRWSANPSEGALEALDVLQKPSEIHSPEVELELKKKKRLTGADMWFGERLAGDLGAKVPAELVAGRDAARALFDTGKVMLPAKKQEAWRYTNLATIWACKGSSEEQEEVEVDEGEVLVRVVDGVVVAEQSSGLIDTDDFYVGSVAGFDKDEAVTMALTTLPELELEQSQSGNKALGAEPWSALNAACSVDAVVIWVKAGKELPSAVRIVSTVSSMACCHPRVVVRLQEGASASLSQLLVGASGTMTNARNTMLLATESKLDHVSVRRGGAHIDHTHVVLQSKAVYSGGVLSAEPEFARVGVDVVFRGEFGETHLRALQVAGSRQNLDYRTQVRHEAEHCSSTQDIRNIAGDSAHITFKGRILVPVNGTKTDAKQLCRSLLLSDDCTLNAMPSLEIVASDVKCTHGATVADLDEDSYFYLLSRGIDSNQAKAMLIRGFCVGLIETMDQSSLLPKSSLASFEKKLFGFF